MKFHREVVLVVDDAPETVTEIMGLLGQQYEIRTATCGRQALHEVQRHPKPDLVLLDVVMPDISGYEVCMLMRAQVELADIPVMFLTAQTGVRHEAEGLRLGAADYITKPIVAEVLRARVGTQLRLRLANKMLMERNQEMAAEVLAKSAELEAKKCVLMMTSHDLRHPVHSLSLLLHEISADETLPASVIDRLSCAYLLVEDLSDSLSTMMSSARLDAGMVKPEMRSFAISNMLEQMRVRFEHVARARKLQLYVSECEAHVLSDQTLVAGILQNLLSNAFRYTDSGSVCLQAQETPHGVEVAVIDTGRGIAPERIPGIFEEGQDIPDADRLRGSNGLGLSIAKRYAELLGTRIKVVSQPGKGSTFSFTIQAFAQDFATSPGDCSGQTSRGTPGIGSILMFEDDAVTRQSTTDLIRSWGFEVTMVKSVAKWMLSNEGQPSHICAVITDHHLDEEFNGLDVIRQARHRSGNPRLPALILTGDVSSSLCEEASRLGAAVRYKPLAPEELRLALLLILHPEFSDGFRAPRLEAHVAQRLSS